MLKDQPKGTPIHVKGNIDLDEFFGFINVKIESPKDKKIPFQVRKHKSKLKSSLGIWEGWYFSEELKFAQLHGYKIFLEDISLKEGILSVVMLNIFTFRKKMLQLQQIVLLVNYSLIFSMVKRHKAKSLKQQNFRIVSKYQLVF